MTLQGRNRDRVFPFPHQVGQLLLQLALILLQRLKLLLFALHVHTQLTDLSGTQSIEKLTHTT